jgi:hypothetical protein
VRPAREIYLDDPSPATVDIYKGDTSVAEFTLARPAVVERNHEVDTYFNDPRNTSVDITWIVDTWVDPRPATVEV